MNDPTGNFYHDLPACRDFDAALTPECVAPLPDDWIVIATDVQNSTDAIDAGRYKDVTVAGAVSTIAVANITGALDFPFFFGGDGMTYLLPQRYQDEVLAVLADVRQTVAEISELTLRVGLVAMGTLRAAGAEIMVGKVQVTDRYTQAVADGDGLARVDALLKDPHDTVMTRPAERRIAGARRADLSGFSCRWEDIPSTRGETLSLIVQPQPYNDQQPGERSHPLATARAVITGVITDEQAAHPLTVESQTTSLRAVAESREARFAAGGGRVATWWHALLIGLQVLAVRVIGWTRLPVRHFGKMLRDVKLDNIRNADIQKIDGTLKMTLSVTRQERETILAGLEALRNEGRIWYGWHTADRAIMTCLIHTNQNDEVHFVDAAAGGYALAARRLKEQMG